MPWRAVLAAALACATLPLVALQEKDREAKPKESRTAYIRRIYAGDRASYGDACRAVASLARGGHTDDDFAAIHKDLSDRGIVDAGWGLQEGDKLRKGDLSYMLCRALGIKGGLTIQVIGLTRRYAFRECVYAGLVKGGTPGEYVSGRELIDFMTNAEIYKRNGNLDSVRK